MEWLRKTTSGIRDMKTEPKIFKRQSCRHVPAVFGREDVEIILINNLRKPTFCYLLDAFAANVTQLMYARHRTNLINLIQKHNTCTQYTVLR